MKQSKNDFLLVRKCSICNTVKPHSAFVMNKYIKHGIGYVCYDCKKIINKQQNKLRRVQCPICFQYTSPGNLNKHL